MCPHPVISLLANAVRLWKHEGLSKTQQHVMLLVRYISSVRAAHQ